MRWFCIRCIVENAICDGVHQIKQHAAQLTIIDTAEVALKKSYIPQAEYDFNSITMTTNTGLSSQSFINRKGEVVDLL